MTIESKTVTCQASQQKLYEFLSDFNNFSRMAPGGQQLDMKTTCDTCTLNVAGFMTITLTYVERVPYSRIVIAPAANSNSPMPFKVAVVITPNGDNSAQCCMLAESEGGNPMMNMMLKPKLRDGMDKLLDQLQYFSTGL